MFDGHQAGADFQRRDNAKLLWLAPQSELPKACFHCGRVTEFPSSNYLGSQLIARQLPALRLPIIMNNFQHEAHNDPTASH
jgi:hypothetical protein